METIWNGYREHNSITWKNYCRKYNNSNFNNSNQNPYLCFNYQSNMQIHGK